MQVRRFKEQNISVDDMIYSLDNPDPGQTIIDPADSTRTKTIRKETAYEDLLIPVFRNGKLIQSSPSLTSIRDRVQQQLKTFHPGILRFSNPHSYPAGLSQALHIRKHAYIAEQKESIRKLNRS